MRWVRWATYLWPGLPQLWFEGAWSGLALATGFSLLLNLLLVASLVWVELLEPAVLRFGWLALGLAWIGSLMVMGWGDQTRAARVQSPKQEDLFRRALAEYLKGGWFEAESLWAQAIANHPGDVDSRFMLVTLLRRTSRVEEAQRQLAELERIENAAKWQTEIEREKELLKDLKDLPREANNLPGGSETKQLSRGTETQDTETTDTAAQSGIVLRLEAGPDEPRARAA